MVNGPDTHPVFQYLRQNTPKLRGKKNPNYYRNLPWNFCRWVIDKEGKIQMYMAPEEQLHPSYEIIEYLLELNKTEDLTTR